MKIAKTPFSKPPFTISGAPGPRDALEGYALNEGLQGGRHEEDERQDAERSLQASSFAASVKDAGRPEGRVLARAQPAMLLQTASPCRRAGIFALRQWQPRRTPTSLRNRRKGGLVNGGLANGFWSQKGPPMDDIGRYSSVEKVCFSHIFCSSFEPQRLYQSIET